MAWVVERKRRDGRPVNHLQWRDAKGKIHSRSLGTADPTVCAMELRLVEQREEGSTAAPALSDDVAKALERFKAHADLTRSEETADFLSEKVGRVVNALAATGQPMPRWTREMFEDVVRAHRAPLERPKVKRGDTPLAPGRARKGIRRRPWSARTVGMHAEACRAFIEWAADANVACPDFVGKFRAPKPRRAARRNYTQEQRDALLTAAKGTDLEMPVALGSLAGLRRKEWRCAQVEDVDWAQMLLRVRGFKGHQDRHVDICTQLAEILRRCLVVTGPLVRFDLKAWGAHQRLHDLCDRASVPRYGWHAHRHTFGTLLIRGGARLTSVRDLMGHKDISTTSLYLDSSSQDRRDDVRRAMG